MCISYLGFVLLIWFPAVLHAQSAAQSCSAPRLDDGFFSQKQETYSHGTKLTYTCNNGRKPAAKGWWATITCQNGIWSHEPQCIDVGACIPPTISNAKYTESTTGWYEEGQKIRIVCDEGYDPKDNLHVTITCTNGTWSSVPVCERSIRACGPPHQIPHGIIIQEYQDVFAVDSRVTYACEDGYSVEGGGDKNSILCNSGSWSQPPTCRSSTTSGWDGRDSTHLITTIDHCGAIPVVTNSVVVKEGRTFVKYRCAAFYKLVGSDTVQCYSDGSWSKLPTCEEAFCTMGPGEYAGGFVRLSATEYIEEGKDKEIPCIYRSYIAIAQCTNGEINLSRCCHSRDRRYCY